MRNGEADCYRREFPPGDFARRERSCRCSGRLRSVPRAAIAVIEKKFGAPIITKDGVTVAKEIELRDPLENMGAQMVSRSRFQDFRRCRRRHNDRDRARSGDLPRRREDCRAGASPRPSKRGIDKAVEIAVEEIKKLHKDVKGDMIASSRHHFRQQRQANWWNHCRSHEEGRQGWRHHRRRIQDDGNHLGSRRRHAVRPAAISLLTSSLIRSAWNAFPRKRADPQP